MYISLNQIISYLIFNRYIKEFIHGDLGRTKPNLGDLLDCYADIMALDVLEVDLEWPPNKK